MPVEVASCQALSPPSGPVGLHLSHSYQGLLGCDSGCSAVASWMSEGVGSGPTPRHQVSLAHPSQQRRPTSEPCSSGTLVLCPRRAETAQWCGRASLSFLFCSLPFPHNLAVGWKRRDSNSGKADPRPPCAVVKTLPTPAVVYTALGVFPRDGLEFLLRVLLFSLSPVRWPFLAFEVCQQIKETIYYKY